MKFQEYCDRQIASIKELQAAMPEYNRMLCAPLEGWLTAKRVDIKRQSNSRRMMAESSKIKDPV